MSVGAGQLTEHEPVKPIRFPTRRTKPIPGGLDLIGMQGQHAQPGVQQPIDQQPVRAFDPAHNLKALKRGAQRAHAVLVMSERGALQLVAGGILDQHVVLLRSPVNTRAITHRFLLRRGHSTAPRPGGTVAGAHRQGPQSGATSCRRSRHLTTAGRGWSLSGPRTRASRRGPLPAAVETTREWPMSRC
jgi:hypothetical protein